MDIKSLQKQAARLAAEAKPEELEFVLDRISEFESVANDLKDAEFKIQQLRAIIADDSFAITFQTMGQYRRALLKILNSKEA